MGCGESRPQNTTDNFNTLGLAFIGGRASEPNLGPIDAFDFKFREQLDEKQYGGWD